MVERDRLVGELAPSSVNDSQLTVSSIGSPRTTVARSVGSCSRSASIVGRMSKRLPL